MTTMRVVPHKLGALRFFVGPTLSKAAEGELFVMVNSRRLLVTPRDKNIRKRGGEGDRRRTRVDDTRNDGRVPRREIIVPAVIRRSDPD